jgi:predicted metalloprotease with PDZ domain
VRYTLIVLFLCLTIAPLGAQSNRDDMTPLDVTYTTTVAKDKKSVKIELSVVNLARATTHIAMPNWTPGAYRIGNYGKRIKDLVIVDGGGNPLKVTVLDQKTWSVPTANVKKIKATYSLPVRGRRRFGRAPATGPVTGFQLAGPSTYIYIRGAKNAPVLSRYVIPEDWRIANGLIPTADPYVRHAKDYDTFIDAPTILGIYKEKNFDVNGTPFSCVFFQNSQEYDFDVDAFVEVCRKIVVNQGQLYGSFPFPNYVFLFTLPGGGGLEHLNSTSIGLSPQRMKRDVRAGASVTSHEFFHTWNVKRIRPMTLGPFEYEHENYTGNLWVSEGWTSYFGDLTLCRTELLSRDDYLDGLKGICEREFNKDGRLEHSVYWASRNVWHGRRTGEPARVDYYGTGEILGAMIDLKIRHETNNRKSLDDVVIFMNRWFAESNVGFAEGDVLRACTAISNYDFKEFFARHVYGTIDPPLAEYFAYAGIEYTQRNVEAAFPFTYRKGASGLRVFGRRAGQITNESVPKRGDTVVSVNGKVLEDPWSFLEQHKAGDAVKLVVMNDDVKREVEVNLVAKKLMVPSIRLMDHATDKQKQIRESWLTGKHK